MTTMDASTIENIVPVQNSILPSFKSSNGWIGIDIGSKAVKAAAIRSQRGRVTLQFGDLINRESPGLEPGSDGELSQTLSNWHQETKHRIRRAACLADKADYLIEQFETNSSASTNLEQSIWEQAERRYRLTPSNSSLDYWQINSGNDANQPNRFQVCAIRQHVATSLVDSIYRMGIEVKCVDTPPMVAARCAGLDDYCQSIDVVAVLDLGFSSSIMTIVQEGSAKYARSLRGCSLFDLNAQAAHQLDISHASAETLLTNYGRHQGTETSDQQPVRKCLSDCLDEYARNLAREYERTMSFARNRFRLAPATRVLVTGGGASPNVVEQLSNSLKLDVASPSFSWLSLPIDRSDWLPVFANSIALATYQSFKTE